MLKALGMEHWKAKELACSRKGYWRMAKVLNQIFSNQIIAKLGCPSMLDYYLPPRLYLFDYNQLIFICAKADLFGMFNAGSPVCGGKHGSEVVVTFVVCFRKAGIGDHRLGIYCICACNVKSHRVKGGKESHIRNNGCIVFGVAVTVRRYVDHQVNVKSRASVNNSLCVFCDFAVQDIIGFVRGCNDGIFWTDTDTSSAAYAFVVVDGSFFVFKLRRIMSADLFAAVAADAQLFLYMRLSGKDPLQHLQNPCAA